MVRVINVDGPNLTTDKGGVCISGFHYADKDGTTPVDRDTWRQMRDLFVTMPEILDAFDNVTASLETVMAHYGNSMTPADQTNRDKVVETARSLLSKFYPKTPHDDDDE